MSPGPLARDARIAAGLTQAQLAQRLGTTQSAIARLEAAGSNPRIATLEGALRACGRRLSLETVPYRPSIDPTLVARQLLLSPEDRLRSFDRAYAETRKIALAGRRARGELG
jgi:transcriptional regulator with XRE-family HTH domain